jgi:hypothetical protein
MVLFCMTQNVVKVVQRYLDNVKVPTDQNPPLEAPAEGKPISHSQLIAISNYFKQNGAQLDNTAANSSPPTRLDDLLRGCRVYMNPAMDRKPKV